MQEVLPKVDLAAAASRTGRLRGPRTKTGARSTLQKVSILKVPKVLALMASSFGVRP